MSRDVDRAVSALLFVLFTPLDVLLYLMASGLKWYLLFAAALYVKYLIGTIGS